MYIIEFLIVISGSGNPYPARQVRSRIIFLLILEIISPHLLRMVFLFTYKTDAKIFESAKIL